LTSMNDMKPAAGGHQQQDDTPSEVRLDGHSLEQRTRLSNRRAKAVPSRRRSQTAKDIDLDEVRRALSVMLEPGQVTELRGLNARLTGDRRPSTISGYFDNHERLVEALANIESSDGIYITPNPVAPELLARVNNRLKIAGKGDQQRTATSSPADGYSLISIRSDCLAFLPATPNTMQPSTMRS
jgi:hypothetical protein